MNKWEKEAQKKALRQLKLNALKAKYRYDIEEKSVLDALGTRRIEGNKIPLAKDSLKAKILSNKLIYGLIQGQTGRIFNGLVILDDGMKNPDPKLGPKDAMTRRNTEERRKAKIAKVKAALADPGRANVLLNPMLPFDDPAFSTWTKPTQASKPLTAQDVKDAIHAIMKQPIVAPTPIEDTNALTNYARGMMGLNPKDYYKQFIQGGLTS